MIKRMLVPVRENRLRQVAPQLKEIISPEWQLVFLLRYFSEKHGLLISDVSSLDGLLKLNGFRVRDNEGRYAWNTSLDAGNEGHPTEQTSCDAGAKITVDLFSGSLYQLFYYTTGGEAFSHRQARRLMIVKFAATFVALLITVPYWRYLGLVR